MLSRSATTAAASAFVAAGVYLLRSRGRALCLLRSREIPFETLDVFTTARFGGNQLAIVYDEHEQLSAEDMQRIASEFGYSETTFVMPPRDPQLNTAWVRIFSPTAEMPFAGHVNVTGIEPLSQDLCISCLGFC